jgi:hypothetical protein
MSLVGAVHGLFNLVWNRFIVFQFFLSFVFWFQIWVWFAVGCRLALFIMDPGLVNGLWFALDCDCASGTLYA